MERLYCPDFSSVFGEKYTNPFMFPNLDCQVWPIFEEETLDSSISKLLNLTKDSIPVFYHRNISIPQLKIEMESSSFQAIVFQAMELDEEYGIPNEYAVKIAKKVENSKIISSIYPDNDGLAKLQEFYKANKKYIAGFVVYPRYQSNLLKNPKFEQIIKWITKINLPIKIDVTNLHLPHPKAFSNGEITLFISYMLELTTDSLSIIISCGTWDQMQYVVSEYSYQSSIFLDINIRMLGGQTPTSFFNELFKISGFIQNWWHRILLSSGTPTLEASQLTKGWYEATELLDMNFQYLLRTWGFRNGNRLFGFQPLTNISIPLITYKRVSEFTNETQYHVGYDMFVQTFSITQLISIQSSFDSIIAEVLKTYPSTESGQITIKSYHTTVTLILNEHEIGNYLELHYYLAKQTRENCQNTLHTVAAREFRADFNFPDHLLATAYGSRTITYHIRKGSISKGARENLYTFIPFGPRRVRIGIDIILLKK